MPVDPRTTTAANMRTAHNQTTKSVHPVFTLRYAMAANFGR